MEEQKTGKTNASNVAKIDREVQTGPRSEYFDEPVWRGRINRHKVSFPVIFFQLFSAALAYFGLPAVIGDSNAGGVEGGVIGDEQELDEALVESSVATLSPLAFAEELSVELGLNGEIALGRLDKEEVGL
ncbi:hypothetical protein BDZ91DRAFT_759087 [Kalaharituber pfeilii]|nr:hypothetical protein BDZ91DRAFT_759087 [Kalaharituber pfeilii]